MSKLRGFSSFGESQKIYKVERQYTGEEVQIFRWPTEYLLLYKQKPSTTRGAGGNLSRIASHGPTLSFLCTDQANSSLDLLSKSITL
jgi:hypothetical protein